MYIGVKYIRTLIYYLPCLNHNKYIEFYTYSLFVLHLLTPSDRLFKLIRVEVYFSKGLTKINLLVPTIFLGP
jgi:hypothetical protein